MSRTPDALVEFRSPDNTNRSARWAVIGHQYFSSDEQQLVVLARQHVLDPGGGHYRGMTNERRLNPPLVATNSSDDRYCRADVVETASTGFFDAR